MVQLYLKKMGVVFGICALAGCTPVGMAVSTGATIGVAAAQEGGIKVAIADTTIRAQIHDSWFKHDINMYRRIDMTVREGRVLVTGVVPDPDMRVDAIRLAWQADGVKTVINELTVDKGVGVVGFVRDGLITGNVKTQMVLDKTIQSINYSVDTVDNVVYMMGVAQNQKELDTAIAHASKTPYVDNVVSYVRLRGEMPPALEPVAENVYKEKLPAHYKE